MEWIYLVTAGFFEVSWAIELKYSQGFTKILPSILTVVLGIILFKEPINVMRMICIVFIVLGIVGLKLTSID